MNLSRKNILIDNNDDDEEKEVEKNISDEEEVEPDFMDNSGKCWEFGSKIVDEKHLKEWCQNKMGGMIVGKEGKLTRQFHCQIKQCQFKAIFLKSCTIIYTRNKHNHEVNEKNIQRNKEEKANQLSTTREQNYQDKFGKLWPFRAFIGKNISADIFHSKFGFSNIKKRPKTFYLYCQKKNPAGGKCPFVGIYLKSTGCLYTREEHEHAERGKIPQNIRNDYVDRFGNIWKFYKEIGKNIKREIFHNKFGFGHIQKYSSGFNLHCGKKAPTGRCKFAGVYFNSNGCLYSRGKHEHVHAKKNPKPNFGDDYVDNYGKLWPFHAKIGKKQITKEILRKKSGLSIISAENKSTLNLYCLKATTNGGKCPIKGIYLKSNGCLYIQGKHGEHKNN